MQELEVLTGDAELRDLVRDSVGFPSVFISLPVPTAVDLAALTCGALVFKLAVRALSESCSSQVHIIILAFQMNSKTCM